MLKKDATLLHDFQHSCELEWLEANGLGGWSSSSVIGCNTRRYHGLLVAATDPPTERMNLVNKLDETIVINNQRYELGVNDYGNAVSPNGNQYLFSFEKGIFPSWTYEVPGAQIKKTIGTIQEENTVVIIYEVLEASGSFKLELSPLMSVRGYHELMHANSSVHQDVNFTGNIFCARLYDNTPFIYIKIPGAKYAHHPAWFYHFNYSEEKNRGLDYTEDLFNHGHFTVELKKNDTLGILFPQKILPAGMRFNY